MAPRAYSSATPASVNATAQAIPVAASVSAIVVTRLCPTRTGGPAHGGRAGVCLPGASITLQAQLRPVRRLQRRRRPLGHQSALVDDGQAVDRLLGLEDVVCHEQHRAARGAPRARISFHSRRRRSGSTSLVGSSRITTRPGQTVAMQNPTRRLTPPDSRAAERVLPLAEVEGLDERRGTGPHVLALPPRIRPASSIASRTWNESIGICAWGGKSTVGGRHRGRRRGRRGRA